MKIWLKGIWFILTTVVLFIIASIAEKQVQDFNYESIPYFLNIIILSSFALIISLILFLHNDFIELKEELTKTRVTYHSKDNIEKIFNDFKEIVGSAENSIWIVNSWTSNTNAIGESKAAEDARQEYYSKLLEKVIKDKVNYRRIVQKHIDTHKLPSFDEDPTLKTHLLEMIEKRKEFSSQIALKKAEAKRLTTFVLIDEKHLIWQVDEVVEDKKSNKNQLKINGAFVFHNDKGEITKQFIKLFHQLDNESDQIIVNEKGELS